MTEANSKFISFKCSNKSRKRYRVSRKLGKGGFASVHLVTSVDSGRQYACKFITKASIANKPEAQKKMKSEIRIHRMISGHPGIVRFVNCFDDNSHIYIMMEYVKGGTLMDQVRREKTIAENICRTYMQQMCEVIAHLHDQHNIIHRDLKLANVLVCMDKQGAPKLKICDFGLAAILTSESDRKKTICGTPNYIAPEIVHAMGSENKGHSYEVDVWSLGVMMYIMLCGMPPFQGKTLKQTINKIKQSQYDFPDQEEVMISHNAKSLIDGMLTLRAEDRMELHEIQRHMWFYPESDNENKEMEHMDISNLSFLNHNVAEILLKQMNIKESITED